MLHFIRNLSGFILLLSLIFIPSQTVQAAEFTSNSVRLDRSQISTPTGAQICAKPATIGIESTVEINFPSGFSVNPNPANWTVTTTNLPSGATAWPGIGTASSVSSQTITFPSSDLTVGTTYCFNFSGTNTLTNPSSPTNYQGALTTKNNLSQVIDSSNFAVSVANSDQVVVTAAVPCISDSNCYAVNLESLTNNQPYPQDTYLAYKITYSSNTSVADNITLQFDWGAGTIQGTSDTVDIVDYVIGSASNGYNQTPPVIDTTHRRISWTINNFPGDSGDQTVTLTLRTNSNYIGDKSVVFPLAARIFSNTLRTRDSTLSPVYKYQPPSPAPIIPSPSPTANPTSQFNFQKIDLKSISSSTASISSTTNQPSRQTLFYGTSLNQLNQTLNSLNSSTTADFDLSGLTPETVYFFKLQATNSQNKTITSDIFTFKTASISSPPQVNLNSLVITGSKVFLLNKEVFTNPDGTFDPNNLPVIILPKGQEFEFRFAVLNSQSIDQVRLYFKDWPGQVNLIEIGNGNYFGKLTSPTSNGLYDVYAQLSDYLGNITNQKIVKVKVIDNLTIVDKATGKPLEKAQVKIYYYDAKNKLYKYLSPSILQIKNPAYTDSYGQIPYFLPIGHYRIEVVALGYGEKTLDFDLGLAEGQSFPRVELDRQGGFNPITYIRYNFEVITDLIDRFFNFLTSQLSSARFFDLVFSLGLTGLIAQLILIFSKRKIFLPKIYYLPFFGFLYKSQPVKNIAGVVKDGEKSLPSVEVFLIDDNSNLILQQTLTNQTGKFEFRKVRVGRTRLMAAKKGFAPEIVLIDQENKEIEINLGETDSLPKTIEKTSLSWTKKLLTFLLELIILVTFAFSLLFINHQETPKLLGLITLTTISLIIWFAAVRNLNNSKIVLINE